MDARWFDRTRIEAEVVGVEFDAAYLRAASGRQRFHFI
jgi:hypothetical protein